MTRREEERSEAAARRATGYPEGTKPARAAIARLRDALAGFRFASVDEAALQRQVVMALGQRGVRVLGSEVIAQIPEEREPEQSRLRSMPPPPKGGRFDILIEQDGARIVLELKLRASAAAVERQAQRYAQAPGVNAVVVVTTSNRLAQELHAAEHEHDTLGGKPFAVIALRSI